MACSEREGRFINQPSSLGPVEDRRITDRCFCWVLTDAQIYSSHRRYMRFFPTRINLVRPHRSRKTKSSLCGLCASPDRGRGDESLSSVASFRNPPSFQAPLRNPAIEVAWFSKRLGEDPFRFLTRLLRTGVVCKKLVGFFLYRWFVWHRGRKRPTRAPPLCIYLNLFPQEVM